ncbi:MAG: hypothetical protein WCB79_07365 [Halobacteriota archaeon]
MSVLIRLLPPPQWTANAPTIRAGGDVSDTDAVRLVEDRVCHKRPRPLRDVTTVAQQDEVDSVSSGRLSRFEDHVTDT